MRPGHLGPLDYGERDVRGADRFGETAPRCPTGAAAFTHFEAALDTPLVEPVLAAMVRSHRGTPADAG